MAPALLTLLALTLASCAAEVTSGQRSGPAPVELYDGGLTRDQLLVLDASLASLRHRMVAELRNGPPRVPERRKRSTRCPGTGFLGFNTYSLLTTILLVFNTIVNTLNNINNNNNNNNNDNNDNVNVNANNAESNSNSMSMLVVVVPPGR